MFLKTKQHNKDKLSALRLHKLNEKYMTFSKKINFFRKKIPLLFVSTHFLNLQTKTQILHYDYIN